MESCVLLKSEYVSLPYVVQWGSARRSTSIHLQIQHRFDMTNTRGLLLKSAWDNIFGLRPGGMRENCGLVLHFFVPISFSGRYWH